MEEAWSEDNALAKSSVNQMVGLMCKNASVFYSVRSSHDSLDGIGTHHSQIFGYGPESDHKLVLYFI